MNLNLLLNINDFRWPNILIDRGECLIELGELLEVMIDEEDESWNHPDFYMLTYAWGSIYDFLHTYDYPTVKILTGGWMKLIHFQIFRNLLKRCKNQSYPFFSTLNDLNANPPHIDKLNGLLACINSNPFYVNSVTTRYDLQINYCSSNNELINWEKYGHMFLPNIEYSNLYLAEKLKAKFDTDLKERRKQLPALAKDYCVNGYKAFIKGGSKEANADEVGSEVARRNFYLYEKELTQEEEKLRKGSMRKIFSVLKNQQKLYLSIDFEKGNCFELCNANGKHQGEFKFDGIENGKVGSTIDKSGNHDIWAITNK